MQADQLYHTLQQQPFRPMRVHLKDGRSFDLPLRELVVVGVDYLAIGIQAPDETPGIVATVIDVGLDQITRLEPLPAPVASAS